VTHNSAVFVNPLTMVRCGTVRAMADPAVVTVHIRSILDSHDIEKVFLE
jgi:hypothetical protein